MDCPEAVLGGVACSACRLKSSSQQLTSPPSTFPMCRPRVPLAPEDPESGDRHPPGPSSSSPKSSRSGTDLARLCNLLIPRLRVFGRPFGSMTLVPCRSERVSRFHQLDLCSRNPRSECVSRDIVERISLSLSCCAVVELAAALGPAIIDPALS